MVWFGKRTPKDSSISEQEIQQINPHRTEHYSVEPVALRAGLGGRKIVVGVYFSTADETAQFLAHELLDLCKGDSDLIESTQESETTFFATPKAANPGSLAYDALVNTAPGTATLLRPAADGMKSILELHSEELATLENWLERLPS